MNLILLRLLPMRLIRLSHRPSLAAANGQFMLFETCTYHEQRYHEQVRDQSVEDMVAIRLMKKFPVFLYICIWQKKAFTNLILRLIG
jgi:chlorobactene glucosyltransferase